MAKLITWRVQSEPTGKYRSFDKRGWPDARYRDGRIAAAIYCTCPTDDYSARTIREGSHAPLKVRVADYSVAPWRWRQLSGTFATLDEAKAGLVKVLAANSHLVPKEASNGDVVS